MFFPLYLFSFLLGAVLGSFLNVLVLRLEKEETLFGRSHCVFCKKILAWFELVPIGSFLFQRGKCRACRAPISLQYMLVELAAGALGVLIACFTIASGIFARSEGVLMTIVALTQVVGLAVAWFFLLAALVSDIRTKLIPDIFILGATLGGLGFTLLFHIGNNATLTTIAFALLAAPLFALPFFCLWFFSKGKWMGFGDVLLALPLGLLVGISGVLSTFMLAFWIGAIVALLLMGVTRLSGYMPKSIAVFFESRLSMRSEIPFGPFLIFAALLVFFFQTDVFSALASLFPYVF